MILTKEAVERYRANAEMCCAGERDFLMWRLEADQILELCESHQELRGLVESAALAKVKEGEPCAT